MEIFLVEDPFNCPNILELNKEVTPKLVYEVSGNRNVIEILLTWEDV